MSTVAQILVPIDFSQHSTNALDQSNSLAKLYNAEITLLHVIEKGSIFNGFLKKDNDDEALRKEAMQKLKELAAGITNKYSINTNVIVSKGRVYDKIVEAAHEVNAKLIVMGILQPGKDTKSKYISANVKKVVRGAKCPVLTIKGKQVREGCKNIVIPIDLTKESREKVEYAIELGKLTGATIHTISTLYTVDEDAAKRLVKHVKQVKKTIKAAGVNCTIEIISLVRGNETIESAIINYAHAMKADMLMIMSQPEGEVKPFVGSTAENIINDSDVPVMSILPSYKESRAVTAN
jgi:nucleotide-binding universal stress UspA family protein